MGSHLYRDTAGFYDTLRPAKQIPGWTYNPARDTEYDPTSPPAWGKPTCKEWWEDGAQGLRKQLTDEADATSTGFSGLVVAVALGRGGVLDIVRDGEHGVLYTEENAPEALAAAIDKSGKIGFNQLNLNQRAAEFATARFEERLQSMLSSRLRNSIGSQGGEIQS